MSTENENRNQAASCWAAQRLVNNIANNFGTLASHIRSGNVEEADKLFKALQDDIVTLEDINEWLYIHRYGKVKFAGVKKPYWLDDDEDLED